MKQTAWIVLILILESCTITKRSFNGGFHIEWNKKINGGKEEVANNTKLDKVATAFMLDTCSVKHEPNTTSYTIPKQEEEPSTSNQIFIEKTALEKVISKKIFTSIKLKNSVHKEEARNEKEQIIHPMTWCLISLLALAFLCFFLVNISPYYLIGIFTFLITGFILSIFTLKSIKKNPDNYKKKTFTKFFVKFLIICTSVIVGVAFIYGIIMLIQR